MKIRDLVIILLVVLLWESLFGHTRLLGAVELYAVTSAMVLFTADFRKISLFFVLGLLVSLIGGQTIGILSFAFVLSLLIVLVIDRFTRILNQEMSYLAIILFLMVFKITEIVLVYLLYAHSDVTPFNFVFFVFSHFILAYILKYFIRPGQKDHSFIV